MLSNAKPGETVRLTLTSVPRALAAKKTVVRLMQMDPDNKRRLRTSQLRRVRDLYVRSRGGRPWEVRERRAVIVSPEAGATWTLRVDPALLPDIRSVEKHLKIERA